MYENFADIYDRLMYDIDYKKMSDYMEDIFKKNGIKPSLILDLGCGTGSFCIEMAKRGYEMIGVDISSDMLSRARIKSLDENADILFLNQNMTEFELYGTVDVIVCLMDSINYLTNKNDINKMLKLVSNYLNPEGLFIFDVNTDYKFEEILNENVFYDISEDITYIWQNNYDKKSKICEFDLTFFVKSDGLYSRYDEIHKERSYSMEEIMHLTSNARLKISASYDDMKFIPPSKTSERIFYVCKK